MITALKARTKDLESRPVGDASGDAAATDELDAARDEVNRLREAAERLEASVEREERRSADAEARAHGLEARNEAQAAALEAAARHADEAAKVAELSDQPRGPGRARGVRVARGVAAPAGPRPRTSNRPHLARAVGRSMKESVVKGTALWKGGKRAECCAAYKAAAKDALAKLPAGVDAAWVVNGDDLLAKARPLARRRAPRAFDKVMEHLAVVIRADAASAAPPAAAAAAVAAPGGGGDVARLAAELDAVGINHRLDAARAECGRLGALVAETRSTADAGAGDGDEAYAARVAEDRARARRDRAAELEREVERLSAAPAAGAPGAGARGGDPAAARKLAAATRTCARSRPRCAASRTSSGRAAARRGRGGDPKALKQLEKKHKKELDELKKAADKDQRKAAGELKRVGKELEKAAGELDAAKKERRARQARAAQKYWNMMEDMKGKIRVFVRCRPFAKYELEKKCGSVVHFDDDTTLTVDGHNGPKVFNFDAPPAAGGDAGQGDVFEDTSNLIQSCLDGFNVCIFAYGQTGSPRSR
ncbi:hypothetical protein JL720_9998 [Aureococcus anophagefferens]|nr:hypothetical protein JL720_9998 [Aureococcus anophagefferens]